MTRGEYLKNMLQTVFGTYYIEFLKNDNDTVCYEKRGYFCKDCSYTDNYKKRLIDLFQNLFDERYSKISIRKNNNSKPVIPINEYRERAKDFIFSIEGFHSYEIIDIKKSLSDSMIYEIYRKIIIETIFDIGDLKSGTERRNDNFDKDIHSTFNAVLIYVKTIIPEIVGRLHKNRFFMELTETYPIFEKLNLEEDNLIVEKQLKKEEKYVRSTFGRSNMDMFERIDLIETYNNDFNEFAKYVNKAIMTEEDFLDLDMKLDELLVEIQEYNVLFNKEKVDEFVASTVRLYNHLYGKGHQEYEDVTYLAAWNTHVKFVDYLFSLSLFLKEYLIPQNWLRQALYKTAKIW